MAFLVSAMSVFAVASDDEVTEESGVTAVFNRGFDDGWDWLNGAALVAAGHNVGFGEEPTATGVNHYFEMTTEATSGNCYWDISSSSKESAATEYVLEFDMRSEGITRTAALSLLYARIGGTTSNDNKSKLLQRTGAGALNFTWGTTINISPTMPEEWMHLAFIFNVDEKASSITVTCYADGELIGSGTVTYTTALDLTRFRFQVNSTDACPVGDNVCLDNVKYYTGTSEITELDPKDYGTVVDASKAKTIVIEGVKDDTSEKSSAECLEEAYVMKVGTKRALKAGKRVDIFDGPLAGQYGNPLTVDGVVYVPLLPILEHMGANYSMAGSSSIDIAIAAKDPETGAVTTGVSSIYMGRDEALVANKVVKLTGAPGVIHTGLYYTDDNGEEVEATYTVIAMDDLEKIFPGWYVTYDDMGLIIIAERDNLVHRDSSLDKMIELMQEFVYDDPAAEDILEDFREATNNFDHPYLIGTEDDFDFLRSIYNKEYLNEDGTANEEFLAKCGFTLEYANMLYAKVSGYVSQGILNYVKYVVPEDLEVDGSRNIFTTATGDFYSEGYYTPDKMFDSEGNFVFPYDDSVRGAGKIVFQPNFSSKGGSGQWDLVIDDYVIVDAISNSFPKKNYVYNAETGEYEKVPNGTGTYDYISYDFVDLYDPLRDYDYNNQTGEYENVGKGNGKYDLVDGNFVELRKPLYKYRRRNRITNTPYNFAAPFIYYMNFDVDPADTETYLELNKDNPTLCQLCRLDHFGYDCGGARLSSSGSGASHAQLLLFAYWMTGQLDYARLAYDLLDVTGSWAHWGSAHALDFAEASYEYAVALDWIYDVVVEMSANGETNYKGDPMDIKVLQQHLWEHGSGEDYVMSVLKAKTHYLRDDTDKPGIVADTSSYYVDDQNNWGNVVNANTAAAAICLLDYTDPLTADTNFSINYLGDGVKLPIGSTYQSLCAEILELKFWCLHYYAAWSYVPDGVYPEAPGYWSYGTNEMMNLVTVLMQTVGHTYTLMDAPGYDKTFIYAASMETNLSGNTFVDFNYNDGGIGAMDTGYFFAAALSLNQPELVSLRLEHLRKSKGSNFTELFLFTDAIDLLNNSDVAKVELDIDYFGKQLDLFVTRSSWDEEMPLFAAIMAGQSSVNHGHLDNGGWVFYDRGHVWITDPGSEGYNVYKDTDYPATSDWNAALKTMNLRFRYRYYRLSSEGHNVLILTGHQDTLPYGQNAQRNTYAHFMEIGDTGEFYYGDENGSFVMYDMNPIYKSVSGAQYTNYARRGMLLTNGRNTIVIQDEIQFANMEKFAWCAHANFAGEYYPDRYEISEDGKSIYLLAELEGKTAVCRMSIVMEYEDNRFGFEVRDTDPTIGKTKGVYLLDSTLPYDSHLEYGNASQSVRATLKNIIITPKNGTEETSVRSLEMAVVMETFDSIDDAKSAPISYEYTPMEKWETYEEGRYDENFANKDQEMRKNPTTDDFATLIGNAGDIENGIMFNKVYEIHNIYSILTDTNWIIKQLGGANTFTGAYYDSAVYVETITKRYESYVTQMNTKLNSAAEIISLLT